MKNYRMYVDNNHLYIIENIDGLEKEYIDNNAINKFNELLKQDLKVESSSNNKYLENDNIKIEAINDKEIFKYIKRLEKKEKIIKKKIVIGTAVTIVLIPITAFIIKSMSSSGKNAEELPTLTYESIKEDEPAAEEMAYIPKEESAKVLETIPQPKVYDELPYVREERNIRQDDNVNNIYLDVEPIYDEDLERNVNEYNDIIEEASKKWGVSDVLIKAILMQESSGGKEINKMQIDFDQWKDQIIRVHNFETGEDEKIVLTDNPENYNNVNQTITREELNNPKTNISVGTIMLAHTYKYSGNNLLVTIFTYNAGSGKRDRILQLTSERTGLSIDELLADKTSIAFKAYIDEVLPDDYGDHSYIENITKRIIDKKVDMFSFKDGEVIKDSNVFHSSYELEKVR